jgi:hypothetical protein
MGVKISATQQQNFSNFVQQRQRRETDGKNGETNTLLS